MLICIQAVMMVREHSNLHDAAAAAAAAATACDFSG